MRTAVLVAALLLSGCAAPGLRPFSTDGCSLFPDSSPLTGNTWCSCCVQHDVAYWRGGPADERLTADKALRECVRTRSHNHPLSELMYLGVRLAGTPYLYTWFR